MLWAKTEEEQVLWWRKLKALISPTDYLEVN